MKKSYFASLLALAVVIWIPGTSVAGPFTGDTDGDGVDNVIDNCTNRSNTNQVDADADGCGNACDGDFDNSGGTAINDFNTFKLCFGKAVPAVGGPGDDPSCAESDADGSGNIAIADFNSFKLEFGTAAGPSGSPIKAGAPACP